MSKPPTGNTNMNHNPIQLDPDQQHALDLMMAGENVCLLGRAGSGKSTVLEHFRELCSGRTVFLAPTGLAALNIGGSTIHRFLGLPAAPIPHGHVHWPDPMKQRVIAATETVVVDEFSMVRSDLFEAMAATLSAIPLPGRRNRNRPFGGRQIVLSGDPFQLCPVVKSNEEEYLYEQFGGIFAFSTKAWHSALFVTAWLGEAHRQGNELEFVNALDAIRTGQAESREAHRALHWLNEHAGRSPRSHIGRDAVTLCTTRRRVAIVNMICEAARKHFPVMRSDAVVRGQFDESGCPADLHLELHKSSRVMLLANGVENDELVFANGNTGVVVWFDEQRRQVEVRLDDGRCVTVGPHQWLQQEYQLVQNPESGKEELKLVTVGSFEQIPLKLAYAMTIHKAQGMSLPRVHVDLDRGTFASGQLYTALSRCTSIAGLSLEQRLQPWHLQLNPEVLDFMECAMDDTVPYLRSLLGCTLADFVV